MNKINLLLVGSILLLCSYLVIDEACAQFNTEKSARFKRLFRFKKPYCKGEGEILSKTIDIDGVKRDYYLYKPANNANSPLPLVIACHGGGGNAKRMDRATGGISALADQKGFIVVYPQGLGKRWNDGRTVGLSNSKDIEFISKLIDTLVESNLVDRKRVYSTGISNGGFFSQYLAKRLPDKIAAVASVAASLPDNFLKFEKSKPVPVLYLLGTKDPLVPYEGGRIGLKRGKKNRGRVVSADEAVKYWLENNGLSETIPKQKYVDDDTTDGITIQLVEYSNSDPERDVSVYKIIGGGHTWPNGTQYLPKFLIGKVTRELDGNAVIWNFFSKHSKSN